MIPFDHLLGFTQEELEEYFETDIQMAIEITGKSKEQILSQIKYWYNEYLFESDGTSVYNPFSLLKTFYDMRSSKKVSFDIHWFASVTPTFLIDFLKTQKYSLEELNNPKISKTELGTFDIGQHPLKTILFQTGYLTIKKEFKEKGPRYNFSNEK